jgi:hypothetical protein
MGMGKRQKTKGKMQQCFLQVVTSSQPPSAIWNLDEKKYSRDG